MLWAKRGRAGAKLEVAAKLRSCCGSVNVKARWCARTAARMGTDDKRKSTQSIVAGGRVLAWGVVRKIAL